MKPTATAPTRSAASRSPTARTAASSSSRSTRPRPSSRPGTVKRSGRGTRGSGRSMYTSYCSKRFSWPISRISRSPSVVTNAVRAPLRSMRALVASVVPWTKTATSDGGSPGAAVVNTLAVSRPAGLSRTTSVNVPPMSAASRARIRPTPASDRHLLESGLAPDFGLEHAPQARHGDPDVLVADRHRRDPEADHVRLAERAHHAVLEQRFADRAGARMAEADVAPLLVVVARRRDLDAELAALLLEQRDRQLRERAVLPGEVLTRHVAPDVDRGGHRLVGEDARRAGQVAPHALERLVGRGEREHVGVAHPPGDHGPRALLMARVHVEPGRRARPTAEVLVPAADREIRAGAREVDGNGAGRVRAVPQGEHAAGARQVVDRGHVPAPAGTVVDVAQVEHADVGGERRVELGRLVDAPDRRAAAGEAGEPFGDVHVRREVVRFRHDDGPRAVELPGVAEDLVEVDRGVVAEHHVALAGAENVRQAFAHPPGLLQPVVAVPAAPARVAPAVQHHPLHARRRVGRHRADRVAVEVHGVLGRPGEAVAQRPQGIARVERAAVSQIYHGPSSAAVFPPASSACTSRISTSWHATRRSQRAWLIDASRQATSVTRHERLARPVASPGTTRAMTRGTSARGVAPTW